MHFLTSCECVCVNVGLRSTLSTVSACLFHAVPFKDSSLCMLHAWRNKRPTQTCVARDSTVLRLVEFALRREFLSYATLHSSAMQGRRTLQAMMIATCVAAVAVFDGGIRTRRPERAI